MDYFYIAAAVYLVAVFLCFIREDM